MTPETSAVSRRPIVVPLFRAVTCTPAVRSRRLLHPYTLGLPMDRITRLRRWLALIAIVMIVIVASMYFYARWRVRNALKDLPGKIDVNIQQTAQGFKVSKSEQGRTIFTVQASKAVKFKKGGLTE